MANKRVDRSNHDPVFVRDLAGRLFHDFYHWRGTLNGHGIMTNDSPSRAQVAAACIAAAEAFMVEWTQHVERVTEEGGPPGMRKV